MNKRSKRIFNFVVLFSLVGCSVWTQSPNTVLTRKPNSSGYASEEAASTTASIHAPYAVLSTRIYDRDPYVQDSEKDAARTSSGCGQDIFSQALAGWQRWPDFPPQELSAILNESNMHVEVWQNLLLEDPQIVVVFEGTVFTSLNHWKANLRWFLRFLPGYHDHYTIATKQVAEAFLESLQASSEYQIGDDSMLRLQDGRTLKLIATGHSLGGGLAQQFAYALPQNPSNPAGPHVHEVFAFDPSPVTG